MAVDEPAASRDPGRVAVIIGAAGGVGSATARAFATAGTRLLLVDRDPSALETLVRELGQGGGDTLTHVADVTELGEVEASIAHAESAWGRVDDLVCVAGGGTPESLRTTTRDSWDRVIALNLTGPLNCIQAAAPALRRAGGGSIVAVGSLAGIRISTNNGPSYTAAKAGLLGLTRHAAFELARDGITVNAVLPGPTLTPQIEAKMSPADIDRVAEAIPIGRWTRPAEVAEAILFLCGPVSRSITGTSLVIDGGLHIGATSSIDDYLARRDRTT
ncbi:MAG TPA: SDR family oxidoreductase [Pseudolysinimonas sp.]|nr:SDR family oxidoreductase [Pseudolysinimonas sp.]